MNGSKLRDTLPEMNELELYDWRIEVTHDPGALFGHGQMEEIVIASYSEQHQLDTLNQALKRAIIQELQRCAKTV